MLVVYVLFATIAVQGGEGAVLAILFLVCSEDEEVCGRVPKPMQRAALWFAARCMG